MKVMKFKPEILKKHLESEMNEKSNRIVIVTTRDECKGKYGDLFTVEGLKNPFVLQAVSEFDGFCEYARDFCLPKADLEGYEPDELLKEVMSIYPNAEKLWVHWLMECFTE